MNPSAKVAAAVVGLSAGVAFAAPQAIGDGGLSISPSIIQGPSSPGVLATVSINNTSTVPMQITASVRPWVQALTGAITPNTHRTLDSDIALSSHSFSLPAGQTQTITLTLLRTPAKNALYGNLDVVGVPPKNRTGNGVTVNYRLIGSVRVLAPTADQKLTAAAKAVRETGSHLRGELALAIRNTGNTIDPITGTFQIHGAVGSISGAIPSETIVPGATVDAPLTRLRGQLQAGKYTAIITLKQNGSTIVAGLHRKFTVH
jgi:hypothetical protein